MNNNNSSFVEKRIKRKKRTVSFIFLFLLIAVAIILILKTDLFSIKSVEVQGNHYLTTDHIITYSGINIGNNIFKENIGNIKSNLLKEPYISNAQVERVFTSKIRIIVEERKRVAAIPFMGNFIIIDCEGYVLESKSVSDDLVLVKGLDISSFNEGYMLNVTDKVQLEKVLHIINELKNSDVTINEVDITNTEDIRFNISKHLVCKVGNGTNLNYKLKVLPNILKDLAEKDIVRGIIDLSGEGYPRYRPVE